MIIKKDTKKIKYLYHYTPKENVESIMSSGVIKSKDQYTFFTDNYYKSIQLFEDEMMSNRYHITIDRVLKRRSYANPDDYRIIKIPYHNDGNFVKMIFDHQPKNNIYNVSTIHKGNLYFKKEEAEVLEIPVQKGNLFLPEFFSKIAFLMTMFINPIIAKADTWLDSPSYYSTTWFDPSIYDTTTQYTISTAKELAGLSYLANIEGYTFEGKDIIFQFPCSSPTASVCKIEAVNHDWVYLPDSFQGRFENRIFDNYGRPCGNHYIVIGTEEKGQVNIKEDDQCIIYRNSQTQGSATVGNCRGLNVYYPGYYRIIPVMENGTLSITRKASMGDKTVTFGLTPDYGYVLESFTVKDSSNRTVTVTETSNNKYTFTMPQKEVTINATFAKSLFTINISLDHATIEPEGPLEIYYLENQTFRVQADIGYEVKGYQINEGELIPINNSEFEITVDQNMTIQVVVEPIDYTLEDESKDKQYIFNVIEPFDEIKEIKLCMAGECDTLKEEEFEVDHQKIIIKRDLKEGTYTLNVSFANERTSTIDFSVNNKQDNSPVNPSTKRNIFVFLILLPLLLWSVVSKKNQSKEQA